MNDDAYDALADQNLEYDLRSDTATELEILRAQVGRVRALIGDTAYDVPPNGTIVLATYSGGYGRENLPPRLQVWHRDDQPDCTEPDGDWYAIGATEYGRYSYGEVIAHDDPPCDRPTVSLDFLVYDYEIRNALNPPPRQ